MTKFNKVVLIMVSIIVALIAIITVIAFSRNNSRGEANEKKETKVSEVILDGCTNEYEMLQNQTITTATVTSKKINKDNELEEQFILKEVDGRILIYKVSNSGEEIIYENTDISTDYLPIKDKKALKERIKVQGKEKLNEFIENFE